MFTIGSFVYLQHKTSVLLGYFYSVVYRTDKEHRPGITEKFYALFLL